MANYGNTADWAVLNKSIGDLGDDSFKQNLGLATFLNQLRVADADLALKDIQKKKEEIGLRSALDQEKYGEAPVTVGTFWNTLGPKTEDQGLKTRAAIKMQDMMNGFGIQVADPTNSDPNQPLVWTKSGTPVRTKDMARIMPNISGFMMATTDPFTMMTGKLTDLKQKLGATSEGPLLSNTELEALKSDPEKTGLVNNYLQLKDDYDRYSKSDGKLMLLNNQLGMLRELQGFANSVGGDATVLKEKEKDIISNIALITKDLVDKDGYIAITPEISKVTGIPVGTKMKQEQFVQAAGHVAQVQTANIAANASNKNAEISAAAHIRGAQISAGAHLAGINAQINEGKNNNVLINFQNNLEKNIPDHVDKFLKNLQNPAGQFIDPRTKQEMTTDQVMTLRNTLIGQERQRATQGFYDQVGLDKWKKIFGNEPPGYISKAPPEIRSEIRDQGVSIIDMLKNLNDSDPIAKNLKTNALQVLKGVDSAVMSGDNTKITQARTAMNQLLNQIDTYQKGNKSNIQNQIKKSTKGLFGFVQQNPEYQSDTLNAFKGMAW